MTFVNIFSLLAYNFVSNNKTKIIASYKLFETLSLEKILFKKLINIIVTILGNGDDNTEMTGKKDCCVDVTS